MQSALESFATDSKTGFPRFVSSLTSRPNTASQLIDQSSAGTLRMSLNQVNAWRGPYLGVTISALPKDSSATGFLAYLMNHVVRYDANTDAPELDANFTPPAGTTFNAAHTLFGAIQIHGLTLQQAQRLNTLIDGAADVSGDANRIGRFRYNTVSDVFTAYYLAVPITNP